MQNLTLNNNLPMTMSSREIAELTDKEVSNIHRDIRVMLEELGDDSDLNDVRIEKDARGYTTCFHLPKSLTMTLVAGYNVRLRKAIIDRWQQLEEQLANQPAFDPAKLSKFDILQMAIESEKERMLLMHKVDILETKAVALKTIEQADGSFCIRDTAKTLQVQEKRLKQLLIQHKWVYRRPMGTELLAYSDKIQSGHMEHKIASGEKSDGTEWVHTQARVTAKGIVRLAEILHSNEEPA